MGLDSPFQDPELLWWDVEREKFLAQVVVHIVLYSHNHNAGNSFVNQGIQLLEMQTVGCYDHLLVDLDCVEVLQSLLVEMSDPLLHLPNLFTERGLVEVSHKVIKQPTDHREEQVSRVQPI